MNSESQTKNYPHPQPATSISDHLKRAGISRTHTRLPMLPMLRPLAAVLATALALVIASASPTVSESGLEELSEAIVGKFVLQWNHVRPYVRVSHVDNPGSVLWQTLKSWPFVSIGYASENSDPIVDGSYNVQEYVWYETPHQTISSVKVQANEIVLHGEVFGLITQAKYSITFTANSAHQLDFYLNVSIVRGTFNRVFLNYWCNNTETFHGFGEQFTYFNLKGLRVPIVVSEQGVGRGQQPVTALLNWGASGAGGYWYTSYAPKPIYLTNQNRSMFFENSEVMFFDLRDTDAVVVEVWAPYIKGKILHGNSMLDLVEQITEITGRMDPLPDWSQSGAVLGLEGGTEEVVHVVAEMRAHGVPVTGVWLQDWVGMRHSFDGDRLVWNWELNHDYYPNWNGMVQKWASEDIRVMTYINPFFSDPSNFTNYRHNYYQEGIDHGYFVRTPAGDPYIMMSGSIAFCMLDPTNPEARTWMKEIIKQNLLGEAEASGWMADFGEYLPFDARLYSGEDSASFHNEYPEAWAKLNREAVSEAGKQQDTVYFMRSAWLRSPAHTSLFWLGDQLVTWDGNDGLRTVIAGALSGGLGGQSMTHSDIGGYTMEELGVFLNYTRTPELLMRWSELEAFGSSLYRTHVGSSLSPSNAQVWDSDLSMSHFGKFATIFAGLKQYRTRLMYTAQQRGYPLIRPLCMHYGYDQNTWEIIDEYLFGEDILVAPVLDPHRVHVRAYIPAHTDWTHIWSGELVSGGESGSYVMIHAPLGFPPVFVKPDSAVSNTLADLIANKGFQKGYTWKQVA